MHNAFEGRILVLELTRQRGCTSIQQSDEISAPHLRKTVSTREKSGVSFLCDCQLRTSLVGGGTELTTFCQRHISEQPDSSFGEASE